MDPGQPSSRHTEYTHVTVRIDRSMFFLSEAPKNCRVFKGSRGVQGEGVFLGNPKNSVWGTLGKIRGITTPPTLKNPIKTQPNPRKFRRCEWGITLPILTFGMTEMYRVSLGPPSQTPSNNNAGRELKIIIWTNVMKESTCWTMPGK